MDTMNFSDKYAQFEFDVSDDAEVAESRWKSIQSGKKKSRWGGSPIGKYHFLESFAGEKKPKGNKLRNEPVIVHEVDDDVKERIFRSETALQSSSSNYNSKSCSGSNFHDLCPSYHGERFKAPSSLKTTTNRKASECTQQFRLDDNDSVSLISDEEDDNSSIMSSNDLADAEGSSGEEILEQEITSDENDAVAVYPKYVTYGKKCYWNAQLTFLHSSIKLEVLEEERSVGSQTFEWKIVDLICIESSWLDPLITAGVCLSIKLEDQKLASSGQNSGILEVNFAVCDSSWISTQEKIKSLDELYKEKWEVDLDSYESFEDIITCLEGESDSISISNRDFQLLQPEKFINDTIVDFYIEYLKKMIPADERVHFFNSFFFRKLADFDENQLRVFDTKAAFQRVRKWTKKVNIFQKEYIFIPVNFRLHWSLVVICHPGEVVNFNDEEMVNSLKVPCILHMDSIRGSHRGLENCIRCYLLEEWKERCSDDSEDISTKFMNLRYLRLEVPQQQNSSDCGLFMLHYMELFVKQAPVHFNPLNNFMSKDWFHPVEASLKRARMKRLIFELAKNNPQQFLSSNKFSDPEDMNEEEEGDVEFLHETCQSKENFHENLSINCENNRSKDQMDIDLLDSNTNGNAEQEKAQSPVEEFPETSRNDQNHGLMESRETKEKQISGSGQKDPFVSFTEKSMKLILQAEENHHELSEGVPETLVVEDSDDDVHETCLVEDSDSDSDKVLGETEIVEDSDSDEIVGDLVGFCDKKAAAATTSCIRKNVAGKCLNEDSKRKRRREKLI